MYLTTLVQGKGFPETGRMKDIQNDAVQLRWFIFDRKNVRSTEWSMGKGTRVGKFLKPLKEKKNRRVGLFPIIFLLHTKRLEVGETKNPWPHGDSVDHYRSYWSL